MSKQRLYRKSLSISPASLSIQYALQLLPVKTEKWHPIPPIITISFIVLATPVSSPL